MKKLENLKLWWTVYNLGGGLFSIILTNGYVDGIKKAWHTEGALLLPFACYMLHSALGGAYEYT